MATIGVNPETGDLDLTGSGGGGSSADLQTTYDNSIPSEIVVNSTNGPLCIIDNATPIGDPIFCVKDNASSIVFKVGLYGARTLALAANNVWTIEFDVGDINILNNVISSVDPINLNTPRINLNTNRTFQDLDAKGGVIDFRVFNSNAAVATGSSSEIKVMTRPEPDGEARFISAIENERSYAFGADDGDSQYFKMTTAANSAATLSDTQIWRMTDTGQRTLPLQSSFSATLRADDLNVTGNGTQFYIGSGSPFNKFFDQNNDFNTNGTFTAPVTGIYSFQARVNLSQVLNSNRLDLVLETTQNSFSEKWSVITPYISDTYSGRVNIIAPMTAGDTARVFALVDGLGADTADIISAENQTTFSGALIC